MGKKILWLGIGLASYYMIRKKLKEHDSNMSEMLKKGLEKVSSMLENAAKKSTHSSSSETMHHAASPIHAHEDQN